MISLFIGSTIGIISGNYIYQAFCTHPDWSLATERSFFQLVAILSLGAAVAIRSINA